MVPVQRKRLLRDKTEMSSDMVADGNGHIVVEEVNGETSSGEKSVPLLEKKV